MPRPMPNPQYGTGTLTELTVCGTNPTPPAAQMLLRGADSPVLEGAFSPYVGCGHMFDGNLAGQDQTQFGVCLAPGSRYARAHVTRSGVVDNSLAPQADSLVGGTTAGLPATIAAASPFYDVELYLGTGAILAASAVVVTGSAEVASPDPARALALVEIATAQVEMVEVNIAAGFCLEVITRTGDIETL
jgi:hypothetical protein